MPGRNGINCLPNQSLGALYTPQVVGGKFNDRDLESGKILLVAEVLIGRNKNVEFTFSFPKEVAVFESTPTALLCSGAFVVSKEFAHRPGNTFIQQNLHAETAARRADSDRSSTWRAISLVTEGKH